VFERVDILCHSGNRIDHAADAFSPRIDPEERVSKYESHDRSRTTSTPGHPILQHSP